MQKLVCKVFTSHLWQAQVQNDRHKPLYYPNLVIIYLRLHSTIQAYLQLFRHAWVSLNSCTHGLMEWQNHTWSENGLWGFIFSTSPFESLPESDSGILMYVFLPCNTMAGTIRVHTSRQKIDSHLHKNITNLKLQTNWVPDKNCQAQPCHHAT